MRVSFSNHWRTALVAAALPVAAFVAPAQAQAPGLTMLNGLDRGAWQIRYRDDTPTRKICLRNGRELIQLQHGGSSCKRYVVEDGTSEVTVQYTCPGNGYGRTSIRRENSELVQVNSQGMKGGLPFSFSAEARRVGACK